MTFVVFHHGFENGPTERYEFDVPLQGTQGPSWSTDTLVALGPKVFQSVPRCRAMHPDHDCQCISAAGHRGGWDSRHHCWHVHNSDWPAWRRGKTDLILVPSKRNLANGKVLFGTRTGSDFTGEVHISQAHIVDGKGAPV